MHFAGNKVTAESEKLQDTVFELLAKDTSIKNKMALLMMLVRAHKPIVFTLGGMIELSINTFARVNYNN